MAELVAAIAVPHAPQYPAKFPKDGPEEMSRFYRAAKERLDAAKPDVIVVIANDHFNTFFMNNFPTFAIGVAEASSGPNDNTRMPHYDFAVEAGLAAHLLKFGIDRGFDFAVTQEFELDHSMMVPLHYVTDGVKVPVVPIWVNCFVRPLPKAERCYALGQMIKAAIKSWPVERRVVVLNSGHFSLEIGGPRIDARDRAGTPDIAWSKHVHQRIKNGEFETIVAEATPERMRQAGNIGGELLNWIVTFGAVGKQKPSYLAEHNNEDGHTFAAWSLQ